MWYDMLQCWIDLCQQGWCQRGIYIWKVIHILPIFVCGCYLDQSKHYRSSVILFKAVTKNHSTMNRVQILFILEQSKKGQGHQWVKAAVKIKADISTRSRSSLNNKEIKLIPSKPRYNMLTSGKMLWLNERACNDEGDI